MLKSVIESHLLAFVPEYKVQICHNVLLHLAELDTIDSIS